MASSSFDVVVLGAGGAGMMCAAEAGLRGRKVAILDHAAKPGGKIIISGGGRCNFTNREVSADNFVSRNPHFAKSALSRFTSADFIRMVEERGIAYHERKHGQLFCDASAQQIIDLLQDRCEKAGARFFLQHKIQSVKKEGSRFVVDTDRGAFASDSLVVATGGLSIPKIGATGLGYQLAEQFGLKLVPREPALDGFVFSEDDRRVFEGFAGVNLDAEVTCNGVTFRENLLFTHAGLSGPPSLQSSLHWNRGDAVHLNFLPAMSRQELRDWLAARKSSRSEVKTLLAELVPKRLAERLAELSVPPGATLANLKKAEVEALCARLQDWAFTPRHTVGYGRAEVTRGGVDTDELSSKTLESKKVPGLYFIGEVVDVTGWLGGFNYQWAWASGWAAGQSV